MITKRALTGHQKVNKKKVTERLPKGHPKVTVIKGHQKVTEIPHKATERPLKGHGKITKRPLKGHKKISKRS